MFVYSQQHNYNLFIFLFLFLFNFVKKKTTKKARISGKSINAWLTKTVNGLLFFETNYFLSLFIVLYLSYDFCCLEFFRFFSFRFLSIFQLIYRNILIFSSVIYSKYNLDTFLPIFTIFSFVTALKLI